MGLIFSRQVAVVVLCAAQRDLVHAGYLALVLLLFRRRSALQAGLGSTPGSTVSSTPNSTSAAAAAVSAFRLLPRFNLLVLAAELLYQAPLHLLLGAHWDNPCTGLAGLHAPHLPHSFWGHMHPGGYPGQQGHDDETGLWSGFGVRVGMLWGAAAPAAPDPPPPAPPSQAPHCTLPELLGLCKLRGSGGRVPGGGASEGGVSPIAALIASPVVADVLLWVLLRLHAKLCASRLYRQVRYALCCGIV